MSKNSVRHSIVGRATAALSLLGLLVPVARTQMAEVATPCTAGQQPMCYGEHATCSISPSTNVDVYQFIGVAGDRVRVTVAGLDWNLAPQIELYNPSGALEMPVAWCSPCFNCTCTFQREVTLSQGGMFTLVVSDVGLNNTGSYTIDLQRMPPLAPIPTLDYGQAKTVSIDYAGDHDWLAVEVAAGTQLRITATGQTWNLAPWIQVYDSAYQLITSTSCSPCFNCTCSPAPITLNPTADETLYLCISDVGWNNGGTINIALTCIFGNCPPPNPPQSVGASYCSSVANSTGMPATISALGSKFVADNDVYLTVSNAPAGKIGIFFLGTTPIPGGTTLPNSCGLLCVQQPVVRRPIVFVCNNGVMPYQLDLTANGVAPIVAPGQHTYFQAWFRDPAGNGSCTKTTNTSDALDILFM